MLESKKVSKKHVISKLCVLMKAFIKYILTKLWAASPLKFQWQNLITEDLLGPTLLVSISSDSSSNTHFKLKA